MQLCKPKLVSNLRNVSCFNGWLLQNIVKKTDPSIDSNGARALAVVRFLRDRKKPHHHRFLFIT